MLLLTDNVALPTTKWLHESSSTLDSSGVRFARVALPRCGMRRPHRSTGGAVRDTTPELETRHGNEEAWPQERQEGWPQVSQERRPQGSQEELEKTQPQEREALVASKPVHTRKPASSAGFLVYMRICEGRPGNCVPVNCFLPQRHRGHREGRGTPSELTEAVAVFKNNRTLKWIWKPLRGETLNS